MFYNFEKINENALTVTLSTNVLELLNDNQNL